MSVLSSRRYLSVWLRRLSTDRIERRSSKPVETFVVVASIKGAQRIAAMTDGAARLGLKIGMGLADARAMYPSLPVVVVSANDDPAVIRRCMEFGASGFIPKTLGIDALRQAVTRVLQGEVWTPPDVDLARQSDAETAALIARLATLTPQQVRVLMMLSGGLLNKQIAYELGVSEATVKAHVSAILQKLGVESRTEAVIAAGKIEAGQWPQTFPPAR